jgi:hypothetical protein
MIAEVRNYLVRIRIVEAGPVEVNEEENESTISYE